MRLSPRPLVILLGAILLLPAAALAAQTAGAVAGTVFDPDGEALEGAVVTITGDALPARALTATTDPAGRYRLAPVPAGEYEIRVDAEGFAPQIQTGLAVRIDQRVSLDWRLQVASVEEEVIVTSAAPVVEMGRTELSGRITPQEIQELPLNGRDFKDLINLIPGVRPRPDAADSDEQFSIFGERPAATSFIVDGADNNDPIDGGSFQRFNQDAIQEFEVITGGYNAEFGRAQGGVVNVITKSGTNRFNGSAFLFGRNDSLDTSNIEGQDVPELARTQWGGTFGGPVSENEVFVFGSAEFLDEDRGRNIDLGVIPDWVESGLATPQGTENFDLGPTTGRRDAMFRLDWRLNDNNRLAVINNFTRDDNDNIAPQGVAGSVVLPSGTISTKRNAFSTTVRETWVASNNVFLETAGRVSIGRSDNNEQLTQRAEPILLLLRSGFIQLGAPFQGRTNRDLDRFQLTQDLSYLKDDWGGTHDFKVGYDLVRSDLTGADENVNDVEYSAAFLAPNQSAIMEELFQRFGFEQSAARFFTLAQPGGDLEVDIGNTDIATYFQDTWTPEGSNVTFDFGVRYDYASLFGDDNDNLSPRLGASWDVMGDGRVSIRGSAGLFYDRSALNQAQTVPEKGGFFTRNIFDVALPRLGVDYTDSLIDLVITSGFPIGGGARTPAENPAYTPFADALRDNPLYLYELLGIDVSDPANPPLVTADNVQDLSGMSANEVITLLETTFPGTDWEFFDVPGGSIVGDRVLSFFPRGPLDATRTVSQFTEDKTPYTWAYNVGVDYQLTDSIVASGSFVIRRSRDLMTRRIINLFDVPPGDPNFGRTLDGGPRINAVTYEGFIDYEGVVVSLRRAFRENWGFSASYTYSDAIDNLLTGSVGSGFSDNTDPRVDTGPSNLSVPHNFVGSINALLPWDVHTGAIVFWRSGSAFSPRGIQDTDGDGLVDQRDVSVPRNSFRVDPYFSIDMRAEKSFRIAPGHEISVLVDVFNLTNRKNVAGVNSVSGPDFGTPNAFFPGREIQVGVRYFFGGR